MGCGLKSFLNLIAGSVYVNKTVRIDNLRLGVILLLLQLTVIAFVAYDFTTHKKWLYFSELKGNVQVLNSSFDLHQEDRAEKDKPYCKQPWKFAYKSSEGVEGGAAAGPGGTGASAKKSSKVDVPEFYPMA